MTDTTHGDRDQILGRIREALSRGTDAGVKTKTLAVRSGQKIPDHASHHKTPPPSDAPTDTWMPTVGTTHIDKISQFARCSATLNTCFLTVPDVEAARAAVRDIAKRNHWQKIGAHHHPLVERCVADTGLDACWTDDLHGYDVDELETCDAGITACDALIAQTGSILVTCRRHGGRALSVLPPHHIVVATADQLLPDLAAGYRFLHETYGEQLPSQITLITGPSRTGDIERILVLGAHGPRELTVLLIDKAGVTARG